MAIPQPTFRGSRENARQQRNTVMQQGSAQLIQAIQHNREFEEQQHQFNVLQEGALVNGILEEVYQNNIGMMANDDAGRELLSSFLGHVSRDSARGERLAQLMQRAPRTAGMMAFEAMNAYASGNIGAAMQALEELDENPPPPETPVNFSPAPETEERARREVERGPAQTLNFGRPTPGEIETGQGIQPTREDRLLHAFLTNISGGQAPSIDRNTSGSIRFPDESGPDAPWLSMADIQERLRDIGIDMPIAELEAGSARQALQALDDHYQRANAQLGDAMTRPEDGPLQLEGRAQQALESAAANIEAAFPDQEHRSALQLRQHFDREILGLGGNFNPAFIPAANNGTATREGYIEHARAEAESVGESDPQAFAERSWDMVEEKAHELGFNSVEEMVFARVNLIRNAMDPERPATSLEDVIHLPVTGINLIRESVPRQQDEVNGGAQHRTGESARAYQIVGESLTSERDRDYSPTRSSPEHTPESRPTPFGSGQEQRVVERESSRIAREWRSTGALEARRGTPTRQAERRHYAQYLAQAANALEGAAGEIDWLSAELMSDAVLRERDFQRGVLEWSAEYNLDLDRNNLGWAQLALSEDEFELRLAQMTAAAEAALQEQPEAVKEQAAFARSVMDTILDAYIEQHSGDMTRAIAEARDNPLYQQQMEILGPINEIWGLGMTLTEHTETLSLWERFRQRRMWRPTRTHLVEQPMYGSPPVGAQSGGQQVPEMNEDTRNSLQGFD